MMHVGYIRYSQGLLSLLVSVFLARLDLLISLSMSLFNPGQNTVSLALYIFQHLSEFLAVCLVSVLVK